MAQSGLASAAQAPSQARCCVTSTPPSAQNHVWAIDFVFDACADGRQIKCLTVIDEYTHECLAIDVAGSIRSRCVIDVLSRLVSVHGAQLYLRCDNGPEFLSKVLLRWMTSESIQSAFIDPGKPWQNGSNESFGRLRDECLAMEWFRTRAEAAVVIETWRRHYNDVRPHSSLDYRTPREFKKDLKRNYTDQNSRLGEASFQQSVVH